MPHWMGHAQHGVMPVYSTSDVVQAQGNGWVLLNTGESADRSKLPEQKKPALTPLQELERKEVEQPEDVLELPTVQILPQLASMSRTDLEALAQRERSGGKRPGLLAALADEISARLDVQERAERDAERLRAYQAGIAEGLPEAPSEPVAAIPEPPAPESTPGPAAAPVAPAKRKPGRPPKVK